MRAIFIEDGSEMILLDADSQQTDFIDLNESQDLSAEVEFIARRCGMTTREFLCAELDEITDQFLLVDPNILKMLRRRLKEIDHPRRINRKNKTQKTV